MAARNAAPAQAKDQAAPAQGAEQPLAQGMEQAPDTAPGKDADASGLCLVGNGTWRYATKDDEETVRGEGYFDHLKVRFGMREGDVLLVNANGNAFMLGI